MDYSKIESGITSIVEALKENTSVINGGVDYNGISDMLDGQSDIMKNFLQGSYSSDTRSAREASLKALEERLILRIKNSEAPVAEATTDLIETITELRDLIGSTFDENTISSESIADHLSNDLVIDTSDISIDISAEDVADHIDPELIAEHIASELEDTKQDFSSNIDRLGVDIFKRLDELEGSLREKVYSEITAHTKEIQSNLHFREITELLSYLPTESILKEYVNQARRETDEKLERIESAIRNEINEAFKMCALNRQAPLQLPEKTELEELKDEINEGDEPLVQFVKALDHLGIMGTEAMYELRRMTVYLEELVEKKQKGERE